MGAYEYQALDTKGRTRKGVITGDTPRQVRQLLRDMELIPLELVSISNTRAHDSPLRISNKKVSSSELAVITRQFATLLGAGLTIEEALDGLIQQTDRHRAHTILNGIRAMIMEGQSLSDAISNFPATFPSIYRATVAAGEESGKLDIVMDRLADYTENVDAVRRRISIALIYPVILTIIAILIVSALLTYVVPKVVKVFEESGQTLPLLTRGLINVSEFLQTWGIWILLIILFSFIVFNKFFNRPGPRSALHRFYLRVPVLRNITRNINTAAMARTLSIMVGSGVPLLKSMQASSQVLQNDAMKSAMVAAKNEVGEGVPLSKALKHSGLFPPLLAQMVASGESSGQLDKMLEKTAEVQENELEARTSMLVGLFEPAMILTMGVVVLVIVLAILLPIFDLNELIYDR